MSNLITYAKSELDIIGMTEDSKDKMNIDMRKCILDIMELFSDQGHSGFSASYCTGIVEKLMKYEPLTPLTGADSEWTEVSFDDKLPVFQNKRCPHVFKENNVAYDINGIVFFDWYTDEETGEKYKSHYTSRDSRVNVEFPYTPTTKYMESLGEE